MTTSLLAARIATTTVINAGLLAAWIVAIPAEALVWWRVQATGSPVALAVLLSLAVIALSEATVLLGRRPSAAWPTAAPALSLLAVVPLFGGLAALCVAAVGLSVAVSPDATVSAAMWAGGCIGCLAVVALFEALLGGAGILFARRPVRSAVARTVTLVAVAHGLCAAFAIAAGLL